LAAVTLAASDPRINKTRLRALEAADHLLRNEGLARVTFDGVRKATGISRSTLYRHWDRPIDLVVETWERNTRPAPFPDTDDLRADLIEALRRLVDFLQNTPFGTCIATLIDLAAQDPDLAELHASFTAQRRQPALDRLQRSMDTGELEPQSNIALMVDLLFGPVFYRHLLSHEPTDGDYLELLVDRTLPGNIVDAGRTAHLGTKRVRR
jgi:AcrR family transcriptional regulator